MSEEAERLLEEHHRAMDARIARLEAALDRIHAFAVGKYGSPDSGDGWLKIMQLSDPGLRGTKGDTTNGD